VATAVLLVHLLFYLSDWFSSLPNTRQFTKRMPRWGYLEITHVLDINNEHNWQNRKIHCRNDIYKIEAKSFTVLFGSKSNRNVILVQIYRDVRYGSVCQIHFDISALEICEIKLYLTHTIWDMCWAKFKWCMSLFVGKGTWHTRVLCNFIWALLKTTYTGMQWMGEGIYLMFVYLCTREMSYSYECYEV